MTRFVVAFCIFTLAALLAAVGYVLAKPKWRWDPPTVDEVEPYGGHAWGTGSPWSVTSRSDNGTGLFV